MWRGGGETILIIYIITDLLNYYFNLIILWVHVVPKRILNESAVIGYSKNSELPNKVSFS